MSDGLALCLRGGGGCAVSRFLLPPPPPPRSSSSSFLSLLTHRPPHSIQHSSLPVSSTSSWYVLIHPATQPSSHPATHQPTHPPTHPPTHLSQTKQQFLLACLSLGVLVVKRYREHPPRPIVIWALDSSKQCFGAVRLPPTHPPTHPPSHSFYQSINSPTHPPTYHRGLPT